MQRLSRFKCECTDLRFFLSWEQDSSEPKSLLRDSRWDTEKIRAKASYELPAKPWQMFLRVLAAVAHAVLFASAAFACRVVVQTN